MGDGWLVSPHNGQRDFPSLPAGPGGEGEKRERGGKTSTGGVKWWSGNWAPQAGGKRRGGETMSPRFRLLVR